MSNTRITFYPVKNGDCNLIEFPDATMMIDCKFRKSSEGDNEEFDVIGDLLTKKLTVKKHNVPYLNAFVLTHPDQDHCLGFKDKFLLGINPEKKEPSKQDIEDKKILIGELWYSPRVFTEHEDDITDDALAFKEEAERRMKLWKDGDTSKDKPGNRIRIIGYSDVDDLEGIPSSRITAAGEEICILDGASKSTYRFFIHAPFKNSIDGDSRNETSIVFQLRIDCGDTVDAGKIIFGGDAEWRVWKKIMDKTSNKKYLKWNLLEAPHHCSYTFFADSRDDDPEQTSLDFLDKRDGNGYIVSSSKTIKQNSDNPPCKKAKNRYVEHLPNQDDDYFKCTEIDDVQKPVVFEIRSNGVWFDDGQNKDNDKKKSEIVGKREHLYG